MVNFVMFFSLSLHKKFNFFSRAHQQRYDSLSISISENLWRRHVLGYTRLHFIDSHFNKTTDMNINEFSQSLISLSLKLYSSSLDFLRDSVFNVTHLHSLNIRTYTWWTSRLSSASTVTSLIPPLALLLVLVVLIFL